MDRGNGPLNGHDDRGLRAQVAITAEGIGFERNDRPLGFVLCHDARRWGRPLRPTGLLRPPFSVELAAGTTAGVCRHDGDARGRAVELQEFVGKRAGDLFGSTKTAAHRAGQADGE